MADKIRTAADLFEKLNKVEPVRGGLAKIDLAAYMNAEPYRGDLAENQEMIFKGMTRMARASELSIDELTDRFFIADVKAVGYQPKKALVDIMALALLIGGGTDENRAPKCDRILNGAVENAFRLLTRDFTEQWNKSREAHNNAGRFSDCNNIIRLTEELGAVIGYRKAVDIDAAIEQGRASHVTTTINGYESKIKSLLMGLGACVGFKEITNDKGEKEIITIERAHMEKHTKLGLKPRWGYLLMSLNTRYQFIERAGRQDKE